LRIQFKKATQEELVRSFERIIKREKLGADKDALNLIANLSDGSFRDGVKILEEMTQIAKNKKITKELVEKNYAIASTQYKIAQIIKALENKDVKNGFEIVGKLVNEGVEMGNFMQGLIETLHNSLLFKVGVEVTSGSSALTVDSLKLEVEEIKKLIQLLSQAKSELKYAVLPELPLELVIAEWGTAEVASPVVGLSPVNAPAVGSVRAVLNSLLPLFILLLKKQRRRPYPNLLNRN